jgi:AcrR family transcriptional regulator
MSPSRAETDSSRTEAILNAAAEEFYEKGFAGARVDEIARRVGINKALLYYHVGNKDELFVRVAARSLEAARVRVEAAAAGAEEPEAKLRSVVQAFVEEAREDRHLLLILREVTTGGHRLPDQVIEKLPPIARVTAGVLLQGARQGVFRSTNPLLVHLIVTASALFLTVGQPIRERLDARGQLPPQMVIDQDQIPELIADIVLNGVSVKKSIGEQK